MTLLRRIARRLVREFWLPSRRVAVATAATAVAEQEALAERRWLQEVRRGNLEDRVRRAESLAVKVSGGERRVRDEADYVRSGGYLPPR